MYVPTYVYKENTIIRIVYVCMSNQNIISWIDSTVKAYRELNLLRALDEDTYVHIHVCTYVYDYMCVC